jgi:hypothetical protein
VPLTAEQIRKDVKSFFNRPTLADADLFSAFADPARIALLKDDLADKHEDEDGWIPFLNAPINSILNILAHLELLETMATRAFAPKKTAPKKKAAKKAVKKKAAKKAVKKKAAKKGKKKASMHKKAGKKTASPKR